MAEAVADHPELAVLWDREKNGRDANDVPARTYNAAWWKCVKGHSFSRSPRAMLKTPQCPMCGVATTSLAVEHPHLAKLWHPSRNAELRPADVSSRHAGEVWWACEHGHAFRRAPLQMVHDASCPSCALANESLARRFPAIAAEWHPVKNGEVTAHTIDADHQMIAWWQCSKGHEFQASVRSRTRGSRRCPECYGAWSLDHIRSFVKALLGHIDVLNPSEKFALAMQAGALRDGASKAFVRALTTGRFPKEELEKFADGRPSLVDEFATNPEFTLDGGDGRQKPVVPEALADPFTLPAAQTSQAQDDGPVDVDVSGEVDLTTRPESEGGELPIVQAKQALAALDSDLVATADAETVKFLLVSAKAKLWHHAYEDPAEARRQVESFQGDAYSTHVRDTFLAELDAAERLQMPDGYAFRPTPKDPITDPKLMQRHVAVSVLNERRFGNWSGMGAGKTLSAVLATRVVGAGLTVICCPNAVVDNWKAEVENAFPRCEVVTKTWTPKWSDPLESTPRYLVMNYEQFQQPDSRDKLVAFLERHVVDFVVIDEIHYAKQRDAEILSRRMLLVQGLVLEAAKKCSDLCVLGMSGTPVINTLQEGRSLIEVIKGERYNDIETKATIQNCMRLYQRLVTLGTRWRPNYKMQLDESARPEVDCSPYLEEIRSVGQRGKVLELEQVLTRVRIPEILRHLVPGEKTLVYTHYVTGIADQLRDAIRDAGFRVGLFTGEEDDSALLEFKKPNGTVDVLIASSRVATGVDGLQHVCNKLIINSLPWTNAEYEQLRGRLWRQGSRFDKVTVVIPVTYAIVGGQRWSYCESKLHRLEYKKSIADAAVDGVVPEGNLRTPAQAQQDIMGWLARLEAGELKELVRPRIEIPLTGGPTEVQRRLATYGDFTRVNNRWYAANSQTTHARLAQNPEEWAHYHTLYRDLRASWTVVPFQEEIRWLGQREGWVVGDFGCGEALLAQAVSARHKVYSFDHVAINEQVLACDIAKVPLDDEELDLAIFSLALMGTNFTDYIREAHRCLRLDGRIHIWEPASYFDDVDAFVGALGKLGFEMVTPHREGPFVRITAVKGTAKPAPGVSLPFRGHGGAAGSGA